MTTREGLAVSLDEVVGLLDLDFMEADVFAGGHTAMSAVLDHVFGGLVAAQAIMAAGRTVPADRAVHSTHGYFLRPGDHRAPMRLEVDRTRDGGSFSHRRVGVLQHGQLIADFSLSFARPLSGPEHQLPAPAAPGAIQLRPDREVLAERPDMHPAATAREAFDLRTVGLTEEAAEGMLQWLRADGEPGDDPLVHAALLAYATDLRILQPILRRHGASLLDGGHPRVVPATVDHTVWFHAPTRVDEWLLVSADSPWAGAGRGLARASVYDLAGRLVADVAQEAMVRFRS